MTLKTVTTKSLAATTIAAAALVGTSSFATAAEASTTSAGGTEVEAGDASSANPSAEVQFDSIGDFLHHYEGQSLKNSKGGYQGECVSLISRVLEEVHGVDHSAWGNAIDYQKGGIGGQNMAASGFTWNTDHNFENGDILVWVMAPRPTAMATSESTTKDRSGSRTSTATGPSIPTMA